MNNTCIVCGSKEWLNRKEKPTSWRSTGETFNLIECKKCGLIKTDPLISKENISDYYATETYDSHKSNRFKNLFDWIYSIVKTYSYRIKLIIIQKHISAPLEKLSFLDYGCGNGGFLEYMAKKTHNACGVEFNEMIVKNCREKGLEVYSSAEIHEINKKLDIITLFHVLEHLYEPEEYLKKFHELLNPNGILVIAVPNPESMDCNYYKSHWAAWDVPIHIHHFKEEVLKQLAKKYGFSFLAKKPLLFDSFYVSMLSEKIKMAPLHYIRGFIIGAISNISALFTGQYSSKFYIFQKV